MHTFTEQEVDQPDRKSASLIDKYCKPAGQLESRSVQKEVNWVHKKWLAGQKVCWLERK